MNDLFGHFAGVEFPLTATILVMAVVFVFIFLLMYKCCGINSNINKL